MKNYLTLPLLLLLISCGNNNQSNISQEISIKKTLNIPDTNYTPKNISVPINRSVRDSEPKIIDLTKPNSKYTTLNLDDIFPNCNIVTITAPSSINFSNNAPLNIVEKTPKGEFSSFTYVNTNVSKYNNNFYAFDILNGIIEYDSVGNYKNIVQKNKLSGLQKPTKRDKSYSIEVNRFNNVMPRMSFDSSLIYIEQDSTKRFNIYEWSAKSQSKLLGTVDSKSVILKNKLNDSIYIDFNRSITRKSNTPFIITFNEMGDTVGIAPNYASIEMSPKNSYTNAENNIIYRRGKYLKIKPEYNDTLFIIKDAHNLVPEYIFNYGDKKPDALIGFYGEKNNYYFTQKLFENDNYLIIAYSKNYDCPNTRNNKTIDYYYALYNKNNGEIGRAHV